VVRLTINGVYDAMSESHFDS